MAVALWPAALEAVVQAAEQLELVVLVVERHVEPVVQVVERFVEHFAQVVELFEPVARVVGLFVLVLPFAVPLKLAVLAALVDWPPFQPLVELPQPLVERPLPLAELLLQQLPELLWLPSL